jgi:hypothetical protein
MSYTVEEKKDMVVKAVLQASEKNLTSPQGIDPSVHDKTIVNTLSEASAELFFQIED